MAKEAEKYTVVIYRTGGWANAQWHETTPIDTTTSVGQEQFRERLESIRKQGYKTFGVSLHDVRSKGLPVGFCHHADSATGKMESKTCSCK